VLEETEIAGRLAEVRERIASAARRAGRDRSTIRLVLASKTQPPEAVAAAFAAGAREFAENYAQEAVSKRACLKSLAEIRWHMIGHLQTNKVRVALQTFDLIQTLDSERLAAALFRVRSSPLFPVLIEVNLAHEVSKSGVYPEALEGLVDATRGKVDLLGLMTIPPPATSPELMRPYFARMRELRDRLAKISGIALSELSMGMTDDFEIAVEEGATIVRVGRAVFGERR